MSNIVKGSVVVCVDNDNMPELKKHELYLVKEIFYSNSSHHSVALKGLTKMYHMGRFQLETNPDIVRGFLCGIKMADSIAKNTIRSWLSQMND